MSTLATWLVVAAQALIWAVALVAWSFVGRYTMRTWWRTEEGRHLMSFTAVFALLFTLTGLMPYLDITLEGKLGLQCTALLMALGVITWRHALLNGADDAADVSQN